MSPRKVTLWVRKGGRLVKAGHHTIPGTISYSHISAKLVQVPRHEGEPVRFVAAPGQTYNAGRAAEKTRRWEAAVARSKARRQAKREAV